MTGIHSLLLSFRSVETKIDPGDDKCLKTFRGEQPFESFFPIFALIADQWFSCMDLLHCFFEIFLLYSLWSWLEQTWLKKELWNCSNSNSWKMICTMPNCFLQTCRFCDLLTTSELISNVHQRSNCNFIHVSGRLFY